jgi:hypothetical protein
MSLTFQFDFFEYNFNQDTQTPTIPMNTCKDTTDGLNIVDQDPNSNNEALASYKLGTDCRLCCFGNL